MSFPFYRRKWRGFPPVIGFLSIALTASNGLGKSVPLEITLDILEGHDRLQVSHPQLSGSVGIGNHELMTSSNLLNWEKAEGDDVSVEVTGGALDIVNTTYSLPPGVSRFFRLDLDFEKTRLPGVGIYSWASWQPSRITADECPHLRGVPLIFKWSDLEPQVGEYRFSNDIRPLLVAAHEEGFYVFLMFWVALDNITPEWLFDMGVPKVQTDKLTDPLGNPVSRFFPYYFDPFYQERFFKLHEELGAYLRSLPEHLRERILFIQSAEGSTGDGGPYKGNPLDPTYDITDAQWANFRSEVFAFLQAQHPDIPILVNGDANNLQQTSWLIDNMDVIALKHGMFSHGFHVSENIGRLSEFQDTINAAYAQGKEVLTRGEMDAEMTTYGWSTRNIPQSLYWSGLIATHTMLDVWNIPYQQCKIEANWPALEFFNHYAGYHHANRSPRAFCALRDGLNAADFNRFPQSEFGGSPGDKKFVQRYLNIAAAYAEYGAVQEDPDKATGGGMINRQREGRNDVGWDIFPGNYYRFLMQLNPGSGDVGYWTVDESIYGRFARGFEQESGKTKMLFRLDRDFFVYPADPQDVVLRIIWLDLGTGTWSLSYAMANGNIRRIDVQNTDSGEWVTREFNLHGAAFSQQLEGAADLMLRYESGDNTIFHMLELQR